MPVIGSMGAASAKASSNSQAKDPQINRVALLLNGEMPAGQGQALNDASGNNVPIQAFAAQLNAHSTNFSPYNTSWSNQFDGSTGYLNYASFTPTLPTATTPFTMEAWIYPTSFNCVAIASSAYGGSGNIPFVLGLGAGVSNAGAGGNVPWFAYYTGSAWVGVNSILQLTANNWYHIAGVFTGTTANIYVNGVLAGSLTTSWLTGAASTTGFYVGRRWDTAAPAYFPGYISNFRLTIGQAVYTTQFAPPSAPISALPVSYLMTCQSNRFMDTSSFANVPTPTGSVVVSGFSPFPETDTVTGSVLFPNASLYSPPASVSSMVNVQGGEVTMEGWVYIVNMQESGFWGTSNGGGTTPKLMTWMDSTGHVKFDVVNSTMGYEITTTQALTVGQWYHIACVRNINNHYIFINGQRAATTITNIGTPVPMIQLSGMTNYFSYGGALEGLGYAYAYISNFRFTANAVYNSNFPVPTSPLTALQAPYKTNILAFQYRQDSRNMGAFDNSNNKLWLYHGGTPAQSTFSPYSPGGWSVYFNNAQSNDRLTYASSSAFDLSGSTWTIEFWLNPTYMPTSQCRVLLFNVNNSLNAFYVALNTDGSMTGSVPYTGTNVVQSTVGAIALNTWSHVALVVNNGTAQFYINGLASGSTSALIRPTSGAVALYVGYDTAATVNYQYRGFFSNLRITKGVAVYTGNFNVPTTTLPNIAPSTSLLTCQSPYMVDNSINYATITVAGSPRIVSHSPFAPANNYDITTNSGSIYFDGSSSFYVLQNSPALNFGTNSFTIEAWIYPTVAATCEIFDQWINNSPSYIVGQFQLQLNSNLTLQFIYATTASATASVLTTATVLLNAWSHVAVTRLGNTLTIYINGLTVQTGTVSQSLGVNAQGSIGRQTSGGGYYFNGYISNLRVTPGMALYYANFVAPSRKPVGGIGTNILPYSEDFALWSKTTGVTVYPFSSLGPDGVSMAAKITYDGTGTVGSYRIYGSGFSYGLNSTLGVNYTASIWLRADSPTTIRLYGNGVAGGYLTIVLTTYWQRYSVSGVGNNLSVPQLLIYSNDNDNTPISWYMYGGQIELAATAGTYSPTPATTMFWNPPAVLLSGTNGGIQEKTGKGGSISYGFAYSNPVPTYAKYGNNGITFGTFADMVEVPYNPAQELSGDFTIELWFYIYPTSGAGILLNKAGAGNLPFASYKLFINPVTTLTGNVYFAASDGGGWIVGSEGASGIIGAYTTNTWTHVAVTRQGNTWRGFINGVLLFTQTSSATPYPNAFSGVTLGAWHSDGVTPTSSISSYIYGSIDDVRITNGFARYTANFIPPQQFLTK